MPRVPKREDGRSNGPMTGGERAVLDHWLDLYRDTVLLKIAGLDAEQLARRPVAPSSTSLIGLVRHLTEVEAYCCASYYSTSATYPTTTAHRPVQTPPSTAPTQPRPLLTL